MFKHYIFTRWNRQDDQVTIYNNPKVPDPEAWMEHRIKLFNDITLPSVMGQYGRDFTWLLSFDEQTPKHITDFYATWPNVQVIYEYPQTWLRKQSFRDGEWIITSRLDNDDWIAPTFIEKVQAQFDETFKLVDTDGRQWELATNKFYTRYVKVREGEIDLKTGKLYTVERKSCNSPFISLIEQVGVPWQSISQDPEERKLITDRVKTVFYCSHGKMEWHFPSVKINEVLYRMVIHDRNISNKRVGHEVD